MRAGPAVRELLFIVVMMEDVRVSQKARFAHLMTEFERIDDV